MEMDHSVRKAETLLWSIKKFDGRISRENLCSRNKLSLFDVYNNR
uniref:Uncharacterized protein n=1 Tax=Glossina morsitans morsitans TaxID=37546 RepID=A0A1B0FKK4_GLOMM